MARTRRWCHTFSRPPTRTPWQAHSTGGLTLRLLSLAPVVARLPHRRRHARQHRQQPPRAHRLRLRCRVRRRPRARRRRRRLLPTQPPHRPPRRSRVRPRPRAHRAWGSGPVGRTRLLLAVIAMALRLQRTPPARMEAITRAISTAAPRTQPTIARLQRKTGISSRTLDTAFRPGARSKELKCVLTPGLRALATDPLSVLSCPGTVASHGLLLDKHPRWGQLARRLSSEAR